VALAARAGFQQLQGSGGARPAGRDVLFRILAAQDGMAVHLKGTADESSVGLAWCSRSEGVWVALDRLPARWRGQQLVVSLRTASGPPVQLGTVTVDQSGAARMIAVPAAPSEIRAHEGATLDVIAEPPWWSMFSGGRPVLTGSTPAPRRE
jgi:hypothetical protein